MGDFVPLNPTYSDEKIFELGFSQHQSFPIVRCRNCKFIFALYNLNDKSLHYLYSEVIDIAKVDAYRSRMVRIWHLLPTIYLLFSLMPEKQNQNGLSFLDFGCGWGEALRIAHICGARCYGVELEEKRKEYLRSNDFCVSDQLSKLKIHAPFDIIYCNQVLEHVSDPMKLIHEIGEVTAKGGYGFFSVPNFNEKYMNNIRRLFETKRELPTKDINPWEHLNYFTPQTFRYLLNKGGFEVVAPLGALIRPIFLANIKSILYVIRRILSGVSFGKLWRRSHSTSLIVKRI